MAKEEWDDAEVARASKALDAELDKIFTEAMGILAKDGPEAEDDIPEAELLPDDDDPPEAEIIDDEGDDDDDNDNDRAGAGAPAGPLSRDELAALIERAVERGLISAFKKLGKM